MRVAIVVFPGSNCDRDAETAFTLVTGKTPRRVWHAETQLPDRTDVAVLPGGYSYGDYLRPGAMSARARIIPAIVEHARRGGYVLGVCNGFQILTEIGVLPGALMRNARGRFVCRPQRLLVTGDTPFTTAFARGAETIIPIAHGDGNYRADTDALHRLEDEGRVAFRYPPEDNPNGSLHGIAGIMSENRRVLGMMPHPERAVDPALGGTGGRDLFDSLASAPTAFRQAAGRNAPARTGA